MSIKKLFEASNKTENYVSNTTQQEAFDEVESAANAQQIEKRQQQYVPQVDYSNPENFAKFGSARLYYKSAMSRILDYYPYDGSDAEINKFFNGCLDIEQYILDSRYPRTNGYGTISPGTYTTSGRTDGYGIPTTQEYIQFKGGPGTGSATDLSLKSLLPNAYSDKRSDSNVYEEDPYKSSNLPPTYGKGTRTSNLRANFDNGTTIEFWLKKGYLPRSKTHKQVIFDWWNNEAVSSAKYGRLTVEMTASGEDRPFLLTVQSGSVTNKNTINIGKAALQASTGSWNHYAIRMLNTGSVLGAKLYVNGIENDAHAWNKYSLSSSFRATTASYEYSSANNLQGWWKLNTDVSSTGECADSSGKGVTGKFDSATARPGYPSPVSTPTSYIQANSNTFGGDAVDGVDVGDHEYWNTIIGNAPGGTSQMTISAWIYKTGHGGDSDKGRIVQFGGTGAIQFYTSNTNRLYFRTHWDGGSNGRWHTATSTITLNEWIHVAVSYSGGGSAPGSDPVLYINGIAQSITEDTTPTGDWRGITASDCYIGNKQTADAAWEGNLADIAIWNKILTADEIKAIYYASKYNKTYTKITQLNSKGAMARIGALITSPSGSVASAGAGKLSGSIDEFRYWKTARTPKQIGQKWFSQVRGGVNSDTSNTTLGVYYKFNEGITGQTATDRIVLDYAGRVTNGVWKGYSSDSRNTGSAMVLSNAAIKEYKDPIIHPNHPKVLSLGKDLETTGSSYDYGNNASLVSLVPGWVLDQYGETQNTDLMYISHIMGAYFDKLYLQIAELPKLRQLSYPSASATPITFAKHLPQSLGLYSPEIFIDATVMERFLNRNNDRLFENDLHNTKNLIYINLYNNLTDIFKSKGTERSIRNVFRCFNVDDKLLRLTINSNNEEFVLKNNLQLNRLRDKCANFNVREHARAVIYQKALSTETDSVGAIPGNSLQRPYGFTCEANVIFPYYNNEHTIFVRTPNFNQCSIFGSVTVDHKNAGAVRGDNLNNVAAAADYANFNVQVVRPKAGSRDAYFRLSSSIPGVTLNLTTSVFPEVYNNSPWNLSVRVKPQTYPLATRLTSGSKYDLVFAGINPITQETFNTFSVKQALDASVGQKLIGAWKRLFVGAKRKNVTGEIQHRSDMLVSSLRFWTRYLETEDLRQHALDFENAGISGSMSPISPLSRLGSDTLSGTLNQDILNRNTLALDWNFGNVTSSNGAGTFKVQDFSSGSVRNRSNYGWAGRITGYKHPGRAAGFSALSDKAVIRKDINTYRFIDPEQAVSSDMIQTFSNEDVLFPNLRREEIVPNYVYSIEKSIYNAISEEMLDFLAGVTDFHTLIGAPVNRYRMQYKEMEKLRNAFFQRVTKVTEIEKYISYYKWFDSAISEIISQLVPASAEFVPDVMNLVESHVLERNKYQSRLKIIYDEKPEPEAVMVGHESWIESAADLLSPTPDSPRPTNKNVAYWFERANRSDKEISSGDAIVDAQRNKFRDVVNSAPHYSSSKRPLKVSLIDGTTYDYNKLNRLKPKNHRIVGEAPFSVKRPEAIHGGSNFQPSKDIHYTLNALRPAGPVNTAGGKFVPENVLVAFKADAVEVTNFKPAKGLKETEAKKQMKKERRVLKIQHGRDWEDSLGYSNVKTTMGFPFSIFSSSCDTGYNKNVQQRTKMGIELTNLHNDVYGQLMEVPMQGPYTDAVVGGLQSRHVPLNDGADSPKNRPEAWRILLGTANNNHPSGIPGAIGMVGPDYPPSWLKVAKGERGYPYAPYQKANMYRDLTTKRPVNIRNINILNSANKTTLGNYRYNYEVLHSFGASANPRQFIEQQPVLPSVLTTVRHTTNVRTLLDSRRTSEKHFKFIDEYDTSYLSNTTNDTIITNRFSAPGGIETMTVGYLDFRASEFSPYNCVTYRNLNVLRPWQAPAYTISEKVGGTLSTSRIFDIHGKDYGLSPHWARHTARFGRDSRAFPSNANRVTYNLTHPFVGYEEAKIYRSAPYLQGWWRLNTNMSASGDAIDSSGNGRDGTFAAASDRPGFSSILYPSEMIQLGSCTFDGSNDRSVIGSAATWDAIIGNDTASGSTQKMTFAAWVYPTGPGEGGNGRIIDFGSGDISFRIDSDYAVNFQAKWNGNNTVRWKTGINAISLNTWAHIMVAYDANDSANLPVFYVNGVKVVSSLASGTATGAYYGIVTQQAYIGNNHNDDRTWEGQLADVAVWNSILESKEAQALYDASKTDTIFGPGASYDQLPGFHKIHRNNKERPSLTDSSVTEMVYDNAYVQHQIPRASRQYMWIDRALKDPSDMRYSGFQKNRHYDLMPYRTVTPNLIPFFNFVSRSQTTINKYYQPIGRINLVIDEPISASTNTVGYPGRSGKNNNKYFNTTLISSVPTAKKPFYLNNLLTKRGATYSWTWNRTRQADHPILINEQRTNKISTMAGPESPIATYDLPPVSFKGRPSVVHMTHRRPSQTTGVSRYPTTYKITYTNQRIFFNSAELNNLTKLSPLNSYSPLGMLVQNSVRRNTTLNWIMYTQNIFPSMRNEAVSRSARRNGYDNLFWRNKLTDRITVGDTFNNSFGINVKQSSWVLDAPVNFLTRSSIITSNANFNKDDTKAGELQNTYFAYITAPGNNSTGQNMYPGALYARKHDLGSPYSVTSPQGPEAPCGWYGGQLSAIGGNPFNSSLQVKTLAGEAKWEAGSQAGIINVVNKRPVFSPSGSNPWFNDYDAYVADIKLKARGYAVIPEFRISDNAEDYLKYGIANRTKFDTFSIPGTQYSSSQKNFYKDFSNTDFLEGFLGIKAATILNAKEIRLNCSAAIKYNPYKGFYPAQRTVQLVEQWAKSFQKSIAIKNINSNYYGKNVFNSVGGMLKPLTNPLFSPGILYNSIKSGLAVDYPVVLDGTKILRKQYGCGAAASGTLPYAYALGITGSRATAADVGFSGGSFWDVRLPFETIIEPQKYMAQLSFIDNESNTEFSFAKAVTPAGQKVDPPSASIDNMSDGVYTKMARNFFGASGEFFLRGSTLTELKSKTVTDELKFSKGEVYMARVKLRRSHNGKRLYTEEYDSFGTTGNDSYYTQHGARTTTNQGAKAQNSYPIPQDPQRSTVFKETFTMYSRPTAFGPSCAGRPTGSIAASNLWNRAARDSFNGHNPAFTPPYQNGEAWVDLVFRPSASIPYDLERVLAETKTYYWRFDAGFPTPAPAVADSKMPTLIPVFSASQINFQGATPLGDKTIPSVYDGFRINVNSMQVSGCLNMFGVERVLEQKTDKFGNVISNTNKSVGKKWIIKPKWETPMLNFTDKGLRGISEASGTYTLPIYGSASVPRGMWHQFGTIPHQPEVGVFMEIGDIPQQWLKTHYKVLLEDSVYNNYDKSATANGVGLHRHVKSLSTLCGFERDNSSARLGELKEKMVVKEAIVAIPYIGTHRTVGEASASIGSPYRFKQKKFISIPKKRFRAAMKDKIGTREGDSLSVAGASIRKLRQAIENYVFPPQFDFVNNPNVDPVAMYVFEFKYEFDRDDLSYIWQNLAPRDYRKLSFQHSSINHNLGNNELINAKVLNNSDLRWMVFKVKQRAKTDYYDLVPDQIGGATTQITNIAPEQKREYDIAYNWPYDYLSFVELIKMDVDILLKKPKKG